MTRHVAGGADSADEEENHEIIRLARENAELYQRHDLGIDIDALCDALGQRAAAMAPPPRTRVRQAWAAFSRAWRKFPWDWRTLPRNPHFPVLIVSATTVA